MLHFLLLHPPNQTSTNKWLKTLKTSPSLVRTSKNSCRRKSMTQRWLVLRQKCKLRLKLNFKLSYSTTLECLIKFVQGIRHIYGEKYLRRPNGEDIEWLLQVGEARGFPTLGSLDSMHWRWENCLVAWKVQFTRCDYKVPTIMLEVVASCQCKNVSMRLAHSKLEGSA